MSSTVGSKSKSGSKIMAPRPLRTSSHTSPTPTSSPMLSLDTCMILEDILRPDEADWDLSEPESNDSAETELQMIFGGGFGSSSFAAYDDNEYPSALYDSDDYVLSLESRNPRFDSFPVLGASPAPVLAPSGQGSGYGVPSRARNPLAQEMLKKKQQQMMLQEKLQEKYNETKIAVKNSNVSTSAVHHLIVSLSATSPPPRHRSFSEPIPFGAGSRTEVGSYG